MTTFKPFATRHPVLFGSLAVLAFVIVVIIAGALAYAAPGAIGAEIVAAAVKLAGAFAFFRLLQRLGWLRAAGFAHPPRWRPWRLALPAIVYGLIVGQIALFGNLGFDVPDPVHTASVALNMMVDGGLQEIAFRGVLLYGLVRVWGGSRRGIAGSVLLSAALFGGLHILNLAGRGKALPVTLLQIADTLLSGVTYATLVLYGESIWPVVLWHGLLNAAASARAVGISGFEETTAMWVRVILTNLPLVLYGVFLLRRLPPRPVVPHTA